MASTGRHADLSRGGAGRAERARAIVFRYDADLFYANASRFVDDVEALVEHAPDPVRWVVLDAGALTTSTTPPASASVACWTISTRGTSPSPSPGPTTRSCTPWTCTSSATGSPIRRCSATSRTRCGPSRGPRPRRRDAPRVTVLVWAWSVAERWHDADCRHARSRGHRPAAVRHGPVQPALHVLHAQGAVRGQPRVPAARRDPQL